MDNGNNDVNVTQMSAKETKSLLAFWIWVLASFGAVIIVALIKPINWLAAPITGQLMAVLAIVFMVKGKKKKIGTILFYLMFIVTGIAMIVLPILSKFFKIELPQETVLWLALAVGFIIVLVPIVRYIYCSKKYTEEVDAVCIDNYVRYGSGGDFLKTPVYKFTYMGRRFVVHNNNYTTYGNPKIDQEVKLLIDPEDPESFFDKKRGFKQIFGGLFIGGIFLAISILGLVIDYLHPWG